MTGDGARIGKVTTATYEFPTPEPEADGTLQWDATTAVTVTVQAGGKTGLGWTYSSAAAAAVITDHLAPAVHDRDAFDIAAGWSAMHRACRNLGTRGLVMQAVSAVDIAWWDLKARLLEVPLAAMMGRCRTEVPIYGSGGFTTLTDAQLEQQVQWWRSVGCTSMKIKIGESWGSRIDRDLARVRRLRELAGDDAELMVDANGGYAVGPARRVGAALDDLGVTWFEEPVSSDDTYGLGTVRAALRCDVAAGEYAADLYDVRALLPVVDCLQLDATRCGGYTGWLRGAALADAHNLQVSAHCAPALHAPVAAAIPNLRHVEWFADHARLEPLLVDGLADARRGALHLDNDAPGHGMSISPGAERWSTAS
ncbi:MAG: enolase C-terminal domain-like protein [Mycobacteriales bacterium]|nr:MAG: mandelate racemase [Pseudonocardiales bacterium]